MNEATTRSRQKAERREQLLAAASRLFAERGFRSVSIEDLASDAGVSGPALYRHFDSKESILAELLIDASEQLLRQGRERVESATSPHDALRSLISFHTEFALRDRDLIRIQDHDFANLGSNDAKTVSRLQRAYIEVWMSVLSELDPTLAHSVIRTKVQAVFGLLNSTPHSAPRGDVETTRSVLEAMAIDAFHVSSLSAKISSR